MDTGNGSFYLINKPLGWTSFDVVKKLRSILKIKKIGHAGTLDPLATGLLIICTGKMTRQIDEYQGMEKEYTGKLVIGQTTPSYDLETLPTPPVDISGVTDETIHHAAISLTGKITQVPPIHSSIKIEGKRAYEFARKGKPITLKARDVEIHEFKIVKINIPEITFRVICSKGTYIRSLAYDFGQVLGKGAYLSELCRTRIGKYKLEEALTLDEIANKLSGSGNEFHIPDKTT